MSKNIESSSVESVHLPFEEIVDAVRSRCNRFALDLIEARERADNKTARSMLEHISGLCIALTMLAQDRKEDWRASAYATRSCAVDWRDLFDRDISAKHGAIPRLGQPGTFYVNVGGFEYEAIYRANIYSSDIDSFSFYHVNNRSRVNALCPLTKTGFHSARVLFSDIDAFGNVAEAAIAYIEANETIPRSECVQRQLF